MSPEFGIYEMETHKLEMKASSVNYFSKLM
jgi:hypothetical protein